MKPTYETISSGADSVFEFIRRIVEREGELCRWKTVDYENRPHYHINLFNGVGGIPLFLADYARLRANEEALELALGALEWCAHVPHEGPTRGLHFGTVGPAFAVIHMDVTPLSPAITRLCDQVNSSILHENPGPVTDMVGGASSNGFYLLNAWRKHGDREFLEGAIRCGEWLRQQLTRDQLGCYCLVRPDGKIFGNRPYSGFAHGISGVAFFSPSFMRLHESPHGSRLPWNFLIHSLLTLNPFTEAGIGALGWAIKFFLGVSGATARPASGWLF